MPEPRKIGVITGSRADYGLLYHLMRDVQLAPSLELQVFVTGMHLAPEFGQTWKQLEADGFSITRKVEMLLSGDSATAVTKSVGLGLIGFAEAFEFHRPDLVVVLGDRFEILAAAQACLFHRIPLAHIAGGDTTEGAFDESIRHAITKMAHLHFVTNAEAAKRVRQMGENPDHIFNVGSPGIDFILNCERLSREELEEKLGVKLSRRNLLITFHPATLDPQPQEKQMDELLQALDRLDPDTGLFFTLPNADTEGRALRGQVKSYVAKRPNAHAFDSLGQRNYLSLMAQADAVVGNSSSGLYEAPTLKVPTVNIGDRQKGRIHASSVIHCASDAKAIAAAIQQAFALDVSEAVNPYGNGGSASRIAAVLAEFPNPRALLQKHFHPLSADD